jgi:peptide chain release factor 2
MEKEMERPDFWKDPEKIKEYNFLKKELKEIEDLAEKVDLIENEKDLIEVEKDIKEKEILTFLSGKYDRNDALIFIQAGAGGQDAQDWTAILLRMYQKYCERKGFDYDILDINFGEEGAEGRIGVKSAILEVKGPFAFGFLKKESGVHRLVRISPFSAKGLRHTSFALVQVLPKIPAPEIKINPQEIEIETFKSSGPGGQYVNKRMTAVRIKHLPTGIIATCQTERSLAQNKEKALEILRTRLYQYLKEKKQKEVEKIKGGKISIEFGNQIRSYVLHPYKLVKDLRTGVETSRVDEVLEGNLDRFIEAEIKQKE